MSNKKQRDIDSGKIPATNLAEILKVDFSVLAASIFPELKAEHLKQIREFQSLGILKRMSSTAAFLNEVIKKDLTKRLTQSPSDTARGWAAFLVGLDTELSLTEKISDIQPFADDEHFGVREWAWMAIRSDLSQDIKKSISTLIPWTKSKSPNIRRFASEATRPRGVWAAHIVELKKNPALGLPILEPLQSDSEKYVRDSVANWLNDASKDQPTWVKKMCAEWEKNSPTKETLYITKKALRTLNKLK